jgi:hypothetical protein
MSISSTLTKNTWEGNGAATSWPYHFRIGSAEHLTVILTDANGAESAPLDSSLYTVSGVGEEGGTVIYPLSGTPLAEGWKITLLRRVPRVQETALANQGGLYLKAIEAVLDSVVMMIQEIQEAVDRSAKVQVSSGQSADALISSVNIAASAAAESALEADEAAASAVAEAAALLDGKVSAAQAAQTASEIAKAQSEAARDVTLDALDHFDDRYLGPKAADPATDNDGDPLAGGALYFNTVDGIMKLYIGTVWVAAYVAGQIGLPTILISNTLSLASAHLGNIIASPGKNIVLQHTTTSADVGGWALILNTSPTLPVVISKTSGATAYSAHGAVPLTLPPYGAAWARVTAAGVWLVEGSGLAAAAIAALQVSDARNQRAARITFNSISR